MIPATLHSNLIVQWVLERNLNWNVKEQLITRVKTPMLIIRGKHDVLFDTPTYLQQWRHLAPRARIAEIDHAGHLVQDNQPELVHQLILHLLASSRSGARNSDV